MHIIVIAAKQASLVIFEAKKNAPEARQSNRLNRK